jgi:hypothetical protein
MKTNYKLFIACLLMLPVLAFSQARTYSKTVDWSFLGGSGTSGWEDRTGYGVVPTFNSMDGIMTVTVNRTDPFSAVLRHYDANCYANPCLIYDANNRYIEMRVKCNVAQSTGCTALPTWGGCDACCPQAKTFTGNAFVIPETDTWTIISAKIAATTGGSQNVIDTIPAGFTLDLANGIYQFDYIKLGTAAIPPIPTIDAVKPKNIQDCAGVQTIDLAGISIPTRLIDGLTIKAEPLADGIIKDVTMLDLGSGPLAVDEKTNIATASLQFSPVAGMAGQGDSIIITLTDAVRGTVKKSSIWVSLIACCPTCVGLKDNSDNISIYPTNVVDVVNIKLPEAIVGDISVVDMVGNVVASQKIAGTTATVNLASAASGMYIIKISDGTSIVTKKVTKN